jgi:hypothetical protein
MVDKVARAIHLWIALKYESITTRPKLGWLAVGSKLSLVPTKLIALVVEWA